MDLVFISGGVRSGKSSFAEELVLSYGLKRYYLATAIVTDSEMQSRIDKHLIDRKDSNFITVEYQSGIDEILQSSGNIVLLDCLTNLVANELFFYNKSKDETISFVIELVKKISKHNHLVIVSNDVFSAGTEYLDDTELFLEALGLIHQEITRVCTKAYEVIYKIPVQRK